MSAPASRTPRSTRRRAIGSTCEITWSINPERLARIDAEAERLCVSRALAMDLLFDYGIDDLELHPGPYRTEDP